jgi:hypothetical protein
LDKRPYKIVKEAVYYVARMRSTRNAMRIVIKNPKRRRNMKNIAVGEILIIKQI